MLQTARILLNARVAKMDERGASAVEYGLLVAGIAVLIIAAVFLLGGQIRDLFTGAGTSIRNGGNAPAPANP